MIRSPADVSGFFLLRRETGFFWEMEAGSVYSSGVLLGLIGGRRRARTHFLKKALSLVIRNLLKEGGELFPEKNHLKKIGAVFLGCGEGREVEI